MSIVRIKTDYLRLLLCLTVSWGWAESSLAADRELYFFEVGNSYCLELENPNRRFAFRSDGKYPAEFRGTGNGKEYVMTLDLNKKRARYFTNGSWKTTKLNTKRYAFRSDVEGNFDLKIDGCQILLGWKVTQATTQQNIPADFGIDESIFAAQDYDEAIKNIEGILTPDEPSELVPEWESDLPELELFSKSEKASDLSVSSVPKNIVPIVKRIDNVKPAFQRLTAEQRKTVQSALRRLGFYRSSIDGMYGPGTRGAILQYLEITAVDQLEPDQLSQKFASLLSTVAERLEQELKVASSPSTGDPEQRAEVAAPLASSGALQDEQLLAKLDDNFLLGDVEGFVSTSPGILDALKLASRYLPAKREADGGERGTKFDSLKAFVLENTDFVAYAVEQSNIRAFEQQQKVQKQLSYINEQLAKLQAEIAAAPLSERALSLYTVIDKYQSINGSLDGDRILTAASALREDLAALDESSEKVSQPSSNAAKPEVVSAPDLKQTTAALESASCDTDPALCSFGELCKRAISFTTGRLDWDNRELAAPYVEFAQSIGLKCGVQRASTLAQAEKAVTPASKVSPKRVDKYLKRKALVIGNANYLDQVPLKNPINDARAVSEKLREVGFEVTYRENLTVREFGRTLSDFEADLSGTDMSLLYYAGHGIEVEKQNYLIPVDAKLRSTRDVRYETVRLDDAVDVAMNTGKLSMVLIDACRNNPFAGQMSDKNRSVGRGLSVTEVSTGPVYQILSFAAASGQLADDGDGANSPYASVLVELLDEPNLEVGKMFRLLGDRVSELTNGAQQPTKRDNLRGEDIYLLQYE